MKVSGVSIFPLAMDCNRPLLSLCIPTNGRTDWVLPLLGSIYSQNVDLALFEVIITDNAQNPELEKTVKGMEHPNLYYYPTESSGFTNQIDAFEKCNGEFCKMLNHRSILFPGSIKSLLSLVEEYYKEKPIIYCANGEIKKKEDLISCDDLDSFVQNMSIFSTWSAGTGVWREDLNNIRNKPIDKTFPHTVFLFDIREHSRYLIWNKPYHSLQHDSGKGGYNLFEAFSVSFLDIMTNLRKDNRISLDSFLIIKRDVFLFLRDMHFKEAIMPTDHTYILNDKQKYLCVYYSLHDYRLMLLHNYFIDFPIMIFKKIKKIFGLVKKKKN